MAGLRAWAVQATLVGDAHVSSAQPTVNAGGLSNLNVGNGYLSLVQFDLGVLPAGTTAAQITRATLRVFCNRADTPGAVTVQSVNGGMDRVWRDICDAAVAGPEHRNDERIRRWGVCHGGRDDRGAGLGEQSGIEFWVGPEQCFGCGPVRQQGERPDLAPAATGDCAGSGFGQRSSGGDWDRPGPRGRKVQPGLLGRWARPGLWDRRELLGRRGRRALA